MNGLLCTSFSMLAMCLALLLLPAMLSPVLHICCGLQHGKGLREATDDGSMTGWFMQGEMAFGVAVAHSLHVLGKAEPTKSHKLN